MPIATSTLVAGGISLATAGLGAVGAAAGKPSSSSQTRDLMPASALEQQGGAAAGAGLDQFGQMVGAGPGQTDVTAGSQSSRDLASMLQKYSQGGNVPTQGDINTGNQFASREFQAQRVGIQQNFTDAQQQYAQQAALQGRNTLDPVFRNKQNVENQRQLQMLGAQQGQAANQFAMQQPEQRLNYAGQRANVLGGLASQAMSNRQALFNMGNQLQTGQQNFRVNAAGGSTRSSQGGGAGAGFAGALAGAGAGLGLANQFNTMNKANPPKSNMQSTNDASPYDVYANAAPQ